jgi:hypothetical protein
MATTRAVMLPQRIRREGRMKGARVFILLTSTQQTLGKAFIRPGNQLFWGIPRKGEEKDPSEINFSPNPSQASRKTLSKEHKARSRAPARRPKALLDSQKSAVSPEPSHD